MIMMHHELELEEILQERGDFWRRDLETEGTSRASSFDSLGTYVATGLWPASVDGIRFPAVHYSSVRGNKANQLLWAGGQPSERRGSTKGRN